MAIGISSSFNELEWELERNRKPLEPLQQRVIDEALDAIIDADEHIHDTWGQSGRETAEYIYKLIQKL